MVLQLLLQNSLFYILLVGEANDDDGADAVVHAVVADAAEPGLGGAAGGAEAAAAHDYSAQP